MASILAVDDSELVRKTVQVVLQKAGHEVALAQNARDGVGMVVKSAYDLILMDLNLPDFRGEDAIRAFKEQMNLQTPIVVISAEIAVDTVLQLQQLGVVGFVAKAEDFAARLLEEVGKALSAGEQ